MNEKSSMKKLIEEECDSLKELLIEKNKSYGNSVAEPIFVFSKESPLKQMCARIDDKLCRIAKGSEYPNDDTLKDLIGYLILYRCVSKYTEDI